MTSITQPECSPIPRGWVIRSEETDDSPVSQICALTVFPSTLIDLVANSTPIVDFDSRLNSFLVKRESTGSPSSGDGGCRGSWVKYYTQLLWARELVDVEVQK